jgi:hypothetical protein
MWQQWVNFIAGLWIIMSAYIGMSASAMAANITVTGIIIAALALWGALQQQSHARHHEFKTT